MFFFCSNDPSLLFVTSFRSDEDMLSLEERIGPAEASGDWDCSTVAQLLQLCTTKHHMTENDRDKFSQFDCANCPICCEPWQFSPKREGSVMGDVFGSSQQAAGQDVCLLRCNHPFHTECISKWALSAGPTAGCPLCKKEIFDGIIS